MKKLKHRWAVLAMGFLIILSYQNCGKPTSLEYDSSTDLSSQSGVQEAAVKILTANCSECHQPANAMGNVTDITNVQYLIYSRLVIPGEPEISPIIEQVSQGLMPQAKAALSGADIDILKTWIVGLNPTSTGGGGVPVPVVIAAKYSVLAAQIFNSRCVSCHSTRNYKLNSYAEIMRTVTPGDAANSLIYRAITVGGNGGKMPQGGSLSSTDIKAIQDWINAGAMNN